MTRKRATKAASFAPQTSLRRLLTILVVLTAFLFQTYAVQTHIHVPGETGFSFLSSYDSGKDVAAKASQQSPEQKKNPSDDPANCPLCQATVLSGSFVMPAAIVFFLPAQPLAIIPLAVALPVYGALISHIWQGRAPPHA